MSRRLLTAIFAALFVLAWFAPAMASQAAPPQKSAPRTPAKKAKKIWTNDELEALRPGQPVSTASSETPAASAGAPAAPAETAGGEPAEKAATQKKEKEEDPVEKLRKRLTQVRADLDAVEAQLRTLRQNRSSGRTTGGGIDVNNAPGGMNTDDQVAQLEKRRNDLLRQITDIEDEARRAGISPGSIR